MLYDPLRFGLVSLIFCEWLTYVYAISPNMVVASFITVRLLSMPS